MHNVARKRAFSVIAIVLLVAAGLGVGIYAIKPVTVHTVTSTVVENPTTVTTHVGFTEQMNAIPFNPLPYQNIRNAWLLFAPTGDGKYAMSVHAEGLLPTNGANDYYLVEGVRVNGSILVSPVGPDPSSSQFRADGNGVGTYFIILNQNPNDVYLSIVIARATNGSTSNATIIATAALNVPAAG